MEMLREGGFLALLSLVSAFVGIAIAVVQVILARRFDLVPMVAGAVVATVLIGCLAFVSGLRSGMGAAGGADASSRAMMMAIGVSEALNGATIAFVAALLQGMVASVSVLVRRVASRRDSVGLSGGAS